MEELQCDRILLNGPKSQVPQVHQAKHQIVLLLVPISVGPPEVWMGQVQMLKETLQGGPKHNFIGVDCGNARKIDRVDKGTEKILTLCVEWEKKKIRCQLLLLTAL